MEVRVVALIVPLNGKSFHQQPGWVFFFLLIFFSMAG